MSSVSADAVSLDEADSLSDAVSLAEEVSFVELLSSHEVVLEETQSSLEVLFSA